MGNENNCFTPWPDMGQAMRVYSENGPSPTIANHHVIVLQVNRKMGNHSSETRTDETTAEQVIPIQGTIIGRADTAGPHGPGYGEVDDPMYTLDTVSQHAVAYVIPIQDGREMEKKQNGFGIGEPGDPMYTLDTTGAQSVAYDSAKVMRRIPPEEGDDIVEAIVVSDLMKGQTNNQSIGSGLLQVYMESE